MFLRIYKCAFRVYGCVITFDNVEKESSQASWSRLMFVEIWRFEFTKTPARKLIC